MKTNIILPSAAFVSAVALSFLSSSCEKSLNPEAVPHQSAEFSLELSEKRVSHTFIWHFDSSRPVCDEQNLHEIWLTDWNECTLRAFSGESSFDGVNFSSDAPEAIRVEKIDDYSCILRRISDATDVTIRARAGQIEKTISLNSTERIELEGIKVRIEQQEMILKARKGSIPPIDDDTPYTIFDAAFDFEKDYLSAWGEFELLELLRENTSFRYILAFGSELYNSSEFYNAYKDLGSEWPKGLQIWDYSGIYHPGDALLNLDWSEVQGRKAGCLVFGPRFLCRLTFALDCADISQASIGKSATCELYGRFRMLNE